MPTSVTTAVSPVRQAPPTARASGFARRRIRRVAIGAKHVASCCPCQISHSRMPLPPWSGLRNAVAGIAYLGGPLPMDVESRCGRELINTWSKDATNIICFESHDPTANRACSDQNPGLCDCCQTFDPDGQTWDRLLLVLR